MEPWKMSSATSCRPQEKEALRRPSCNDAVIRRREYSERLPPCRVCLPGTVDPPQYRRRHHYDQDSDKISGSWNCVPGRITASYSQ